MIQATASASVVLPPERDGGPGCAETSRGDLSVALARLLGCRPARRLMPAASEFIVAAAPTA